MFDFYDKYKLLKRIFKLLFILNGIKSQNEEEASMCEKIYFRNDTFSMGKLISICTVNTEYKKVAMVFQ